MFLFYFHFDIIIFTIDKNVQPEHYGKMFEQMKQSKLKYQSISVTESKLQMNYQQCQIK